ncbi:PAS domain-containing protein [Hymenobacter sp. BT175]|uniref:PAS domain-containing sensor histidine kinase n=1 Tax=Hymenobacter translucens TaxID=2886507 RepID=UPI001D0E4986|nr:PAS domain-containing protein [Hymenobacter translucens]MCC2546644.1 PAS domain-containing protein [Hymenobacter translucens]
MPATSDLLSVFNALPDAYLLLTPTLTIEAASDAYLAATLTRRETLLGKYMFDAFPDNPEAPEARAEANLRASLNQVLATGQPHEMARQHYDVPDPDRPGGFVERHWQVRNLPILGEQGQVTSILHVAVEVTAQVRDEAQLQASHTREETALAEVQAQRNRLQNLFTQAPALIVSLKGPTHVVELANQGFLRLFGNREMIGKPYREAVPELVKQGFFVLLDQVYQTGETYFGNEMLVNIDRTNSGQLEAGYFNFIYQATRDADNRIEGVLFFGYDITEQVQARRSAEEQERQANILNEELQAASEEIYATNHELLRTEQVLRDLNQRLEAHVGERTRALEKALRQARLQGDLLQVQQRTLQQILGQVPAALATLSGPNHEYSFFNAPYAALTGGRAKLRMTVAQVIPEVVPQGFIGLLDQVYATGTPYSGVEMPIQLYDKASGQHRERYIDFIYQPLTDKAGATQGILAFVVDTTDKVVSRQLAAAAQAQALAAAEQMAAQRENFYQVFEGTPASIAILRGPEHRFDYVNPGYQQLFPGRELLGRPMTEALPETIEFGFVDLLDRVYETGEPFFGAEMPLQVHAPDGTLLPEAYFTFTYQAYREQGVPAGVSIFAFDVTEQVLARREAAAQQLQLQSLFEQAPVAVAILQGADYQIQVANARMAEVWGRNRDEVIGKPLFEALPEARDQGFKELLDQVVATGEAFVAQEVAALLQRNGQLERVYLNFVYQPLRDAQGLITSVAAVATEVGEQVRARQQLHALNEQLRTSNAELGLSNQQLTRTNQDLDNFVYAASHDLKQPVNNLAGLFNELRRGATFADPAEEQLLVPLIEDSLHQLSVTIDDLATLGQAQQLSASPTELVSLDDLTVDVLSALEPQIRAARAQVTTDFTLCPRVSFARANLRTVLHNLLGNSLKYADPNRPARIHVSATVEDGWSVLTVRDNGLGFDGAKYGTELFHLFRRLHSHTAGTGVGLYLVNRIVQAAGGSIEVDSQVGEGATFRVLLGPA